MDLFLKYKLLLLNPANFFESYKKENNAISAIWFFLIITFLGSTINLLLNLPLTIGLHSPLSQIVSLIVFPIQALIQITIAAFFAFALLVVFTVSKNGFVKNFRLFAYSSSIAVVYSILGTILMLPFEFGSGISASIGFRVLFTQGASYLNSIMIISMLIAAIVTIASWIHVLRTLIVGYGIELKIEKLRAALLSVVAYFSAFMILLVIVQTLFKVLLGV